MGAGTVSARPQHQATLEEFENTVRTTAEVPTAPVSRSTYSSRSSNSSTSVAALAPSRKRLETRSPALPGTVSAIS